MHTINLTSQELLLLARLVGHHTTGTGLERVYEEELFPKAPEAARLGPLPTSLNHPYGSRPMVKVESNP
jgi:hypothetical protein